MPNPYYRRINFAEVRLEANIRRVMFDKATVEYFSELLAPAVAEKVSKMLWKKVMEEG